MFKSLKFRGKKNYLTFFVWYYDLEHKKIINCFISIFIDILECQTIKKILITERDSSTTLDQPESGIEQPF